MTYILITLEIDEGGLLANAFVIQFQSILYIIFNLFTLSNYVTKNNRRNPHLS